MFLLFRTMSLVAKLAGAPPSSPVLWKRGAIANVLSGELINFQEDVKFPLIACPSVNSFQLVSRFTNVVSLTF